MIQQLVFSENKYAWVIRHGLFWLAISVWYLVLCTGIQFSISAYLNWIPLLWTRLSICIVSTYFTLYVVIPRYVLTKRYSVVIRILILMGTLYPIAFMIDPLSYLIFPESHRLVQQHWSDGTFNMEDIQAIKASVRDGWGLTLAVNGFAAVVKLMKMYYLENSQNERLQQQRTNQALQMLKSQLNSRFLFDVLRNIQYRVQNHLEGSPSLILKLSDLLSYTLYEHEESSVPLKKELEIIEAYLKLERENHQSCIKITVSQEGEVEQQRIVPLVLLPLVESCFETGDLLNSADAEIKLMVNVTPLGLLVTMEAHKFVALSQFTFETNFRIQNMRHRLDQYYRGKHKLKMVTDLNSYSVQLAIDF